MSTHTCGMDVSCSFKNYKFVAGSCTNDRRDRTKKTNIVSLLSCDKDISGHTSFLSITDVNSEMELLLARVAIFSPPNDIQALTICPFHSSSLGIGSTGNITSRRARKKVAKAERGLSKAGSQMILKLSGVFVPVGSGKCLSSTVTALLLYRKALFSILFLSTCIPPYPLSSPKVLIPRLRETHCKRFKQLLKSQHFLSLV